MTWQLSMRQAHDQACVAQIPWESSPSIQRTGVDKNLVIEVRPPHHLKLAQGRGLQHLKWPLFIFIFMGLVGYLGHSKRCIQNGLYFPNYWKGPFATSWKLRSTKEHQYKGPCAMSRRLRHPPQRLCRTLLFFHTGTSIHRSCLYLLRRPFL